MESYEDRLHRLYAGWTDEEVKAAMEALRESQHYYKVTWDDIWREHARRTFSEDVVCRRCGSENHTAVTHADFA